ncbi:MAG: response regulator, partial [Methanoregula sp.]
MANHTRGDHAFVPSPVNASAGDTKADEESPVISVLYVDDEHSLLEPTKLSLEKRGNITVDTSSSAHDALEKMRTKTYDVIISDYQMPELDGIEFLKRLRKSGNLIPFIIFTGKGREDAVIEAYDAGADFYLAKGGNPKAMFLDLTNKIVQSVTRRRAEKALRESEERYRKVMEQSHDAIFIVRGSNFIFVNNQVSVISGYSKPELYTMEIWDLLHPDDRERVMEISRSRGAGGPTPHTYEARVIVKSGEVRYLEFAVTNVVSNGENALLCSV